MKYYCNFLTLSLISVSTVTLSLVNEKRVSAIGCDTYYRVTGQIAGCTDVSTENVQDLWLQKYSICLNQQLDQEISIYRGKLETNYARGKYNSEENKIGNIWLQNTNTSFLSLSNNPAITYRGNANFCHQESK
ncbi:MAG: hypothetical protein RLZZ535_548 [Cyanobacteriota bacterium]|jgi:hypothetical protein